MLNDYQIVLKGSDELTDLQKDQLMILSIAEYPPYEKYYRVNKYFSVIKPQIVGLVLRGQEIIGDGKLLWHDVKVSDHTFKLFGFGLTIRKEFQGEGLGTSLVKHFVEKAKELEADIIYATSDNPVIDHMLLVTFGFSKLAVPVEYIHAVTGASEREEKKVYVYFRNTEVARAIESLSVFNIGKGPI
jgi:GNAT superfamily N-acetyltransferase